MFSNFNGPQFLLFYFVYSLILLIGTWFCKNQKLESLHKEVQVTDLDLKDINSFEIAYLEGGKHKVIQTIILSLIQKGYLSNPTQSNFLPITSKTDLSDLEKVEEKAFIAIKSSLELEKAYRNIERKLRLDFAGYEYSLQNDCLLSSPSDKMKIALIIFIGVSLLFGVGFYRLFHSLAHGHKNIGFLSLMLILNAFIFFKISQIPRITKIGQEYLDKLENTLVNEKFNSNKITPLMFAVMGLSILPGTEFNDAHVLLSGFKHKKNSDSNGCSSGCSSGDSGGDSGCGSGCGGCGGD